MNSKDIELFNYVYSAMFENEKSDDIKWKEFEKICISKMNYVPFDFIVTHKSLVTMNEKNMWQDICGNKVTAGKFIILNYIGSNEYITYKTNQIKSLIKKYGITTFSNLENIFDNMNNESIKELLFNFRNNDLINFDDSIFKYADDELYSILYDCITVILNTYPVERDRSNITNINLGQIVNQSGNNNSATINVASDEKLFELVNNKMELLEFELRKSNCEKEINDLKDAIKVKDKTSVLEILSNLSSIGSFIAPGIIAFFNQLH